MIMTGLQQKLSTGLALLALVGTITYVLTDEKTASYLHGRVTKVTHNGTSTTATRRRRQIQISNCTLTPPIDPAALPQFYQNSPCAQILLGNILGKTTSMDDASTRNIIPRRWLLLGDSTMAKLFKNSMRPVLIQGPQLEQLYKSNYKTDPTVQKCLKKKKLNITTNTKKSPSSMPTLKCTNRLHQRCQLNQYFQFPPIPLPPQQRRKRRRLGSNMTSSMTSNTTTQTWIMPDPSKGEGPALFGHDNPNCQDCGGCNSEYTFCDFVMDGEEPSPPPPNPQQPSQRRRLQQHIRKQHRHRRRRLQETTAMDHENDNADECHLNSTAMRSFFAGHAYGGYFSIEYARDVEIQTRHYKTTQENVVGVFVPQHYNQNHHHQQQQQQQRDNDDTDRAATMDTRLPASSTMTSSTSDLFGGPPICVVSSGIHDMRVGVVGWNPTNKTGADLDMYLYNVRHYLGLLQRQCSHIVWILNATPVRKNDTDPLYAPHPQTVERVQIWNRATQDLLMEWNSISNENNNNNNDNGSNNVVLQSLTVIDVFEASTKWPRPASYDNVHLTPAWYHALGLFLVYTHTQLIAATVAQQ